MGDVVRRDDCGGAWLVELGGRRRKLGPISNPSYHIFEEQAKMKYFLGI